MSAPTAAAAPALRIGPLELASPVVLAPMAGVTNVAFRTLCRELEREQQGSVSGLYVCEMVTARALVERQPGTLHMASSGAVAGPRSPTSADCSARSSRLPSAPPRARTSR